MPLRLTEHHWLHNADDRIYIIYSLFLTYLFLIDLYLLLHANSDIYASLLTLLVYLIIYLFY